MVTQDFAYSGTGSFITGVAFDDKDGDHFYDVGEALAGLSVTAVSSTGIHLHNNHCPGRRLSAPRACR